jgi:hypothetical protein
MPGRYDDFWEMREGGPYDDGEEVFKCKHCGAVTHPPAGWNGEPDLTQCTPECQSHHGDWRPGEVSETYRKRFDAIFPDAPGAGM